MSFNHDIWKNRKKSLLVKEIMEFANLSDTDISNALGISMSYYNNKLSRNSFDFGEILIIIEMAGLNVTINDKDGHVWKDISLKNMYPKDSVMLQKVIEEKKQKEYTKKYEEFKQKENELKKLEKELQFYNSLS